MENPILPTHTFKLFAKCSSFLQLEIDELDELSPICPFTQEIHTVVFRSEEALTTKELNN
jgi:hypothetical protein